MSTVKTTRVKNVAEGSLSAYVIGFVISLLLTFNSYYLVTRNVLKGWTLIATISACALIQLYVQMVFFLHLSHKASSKLKAVVFWYMILIVTILALGSVWIMKNLDYHHPTQTPEQTEQFIRGDEGIVQ